MDPAEDGFEDFLKERGEILKDIEQFLFMVFRYFLYMEEQEFEPDFFITDTVCILIKSICLIHGLYGYPEQRSSVHASNSYIPGKNTSRTV